MAILRVPIELTWNGAGSPGVNVWHLRVTDLIGDTQDAIDTLHTFYSDLMTTGADHGQIYRNGTRANLGAMVDLETDEGAHAAFPTITAVSPPAAAPPANQIVVSWHSSVRARRGNGRTFLGPCSQSVVDDDGTIHTTALNNVKGFVDKFLSASLSDTGWAYGVWGLETKGGPPDAPHVLRDFVGAQVRDQFAVLRSRRD